MLYVHESRRAELETKGYALVEQRDNGWIGFVKTEDTCLRPMRTGVCLMSKGHRGRCSTVVFYCDACGKTRRGHAHIEVYNAYDECVEVEICFMCDLEHQNRNPWR